MGAHGRITICEHGVSTRLICKKEGMNKNKAFYALKTLNQFSEVFK